MDIPLIVFSFFLFLLIIIPLIIFIKNLNLKDCTNCKQTLYFKYFLYGKICIKHCISCNLNFIRKTQRTKRN